MKPNILVLTPQHTGSSIVTKMLHELGWNRATDNTRFSEPLEIVRINQAEIRQQRFRYHRAAAQLQQLQPPWAIKDPRFCRTMNHWLPLLEPYQPLLLYLSAAAPSIHESHQRRCEPETLQDVESNLARCREIYTRWKWSKLELDWPQIQSAISFWNQTRIGAGEPGY